MKKYTLVKHNREVIYLMLSPLLITLREGLEAALNRKKLDGPFYQQIIDGEVEAKLIALSCSEPPEGYGRWTLRLLADKAVELQIVDTICHETVRNTLKKTS